MLPPAKFIKYNARNALRGKWCSAVAVTVIMLLSIFFSEILREAVATVLHRTMFAGNGKISVPGFAISMACVAVAIFFVFPIVLGDIRWFWFTLLNYNLPVTEVFYYYSELQLFFKSVFVAARLIVKIALVGIVCYIPAVLVWAMTRSTFYELVGYKTPTVVPVLWPLVYLFAALSTVLLFKVILRYSLAPVLVIIDESLDPSDAVSVSKKIASNNKNAYFAVFISFIGWILLSIFGVTMLYTLPFMIMSYVVFARATIDNHRFEASRMNMKPLI